MLGTEAEARPHLADLLLDIEAIDESRASAGWVETCDWSGQDPSMRSGRYF